jgi:hypothetical protein
LLAIREKKTACFIFAHTDKAHMNQALWYGSPVLLTILSTQNVQKCGMTGNSRTLSLCGAWPPVENAISTIKNSQKCPPANFLLTAKKPL